MDQDSIGQMEAIYKHPLSTSNHIAAAFSKKGGFSKGFADALDDVSDEGSECDEPANSGDITGSTAITPASNGKEFTPLFGTDDLDKMKKVDLSDTQNVSKDGFFEDIKKQKTG
jgi:hypothetical protein